MITPDLVTVLIALVVPAAGILVYCWCTDRRPTVPRPTTSTLTDSGLHRRIERPPNYRDSRAHHPAGRALPGTWRTAAADQTPVRSPLPPIPAPRDPEQLGRHHIESVGTHLAMPAVRRGRHAAGGAR